MNIELFANDFCPDDCPYCEVKQDVLYMETPPSVIRECRYMAICRYAVIKDRERADR